MKSNRPTYSGKIRSLFYALILGFTLTATCFAQGDDERTDGKPLFICEENSDPSLPNSDPSLPKKLGFILVERLSPELDEVQPLTPNLKSTDETFREKLQSYSPMICAPLATLISSAVTYPFDLSKIRRQCGSNDKGHLYKGFTVYSFAVCTAVGSSLAAYDHGKKEGLSIGQAGAVSGIVSSFISGPIWVYRIQKALSGSNPNEAPYNWKTYVQELRKNPAIAWRGQCMSIANVGPHALYFYFHEKIVHKLNETTGLPEHSIPIEVIGGSCARLLAAIPGYPIDTLRTIKQRTGLPYPQIIKDLAKGGVPSFYKGFTYFAVNTPIGTGLCMGLYKFFKKQTGYHSTSPSMCEETACSTVD